MLTCSIMIPSPILLSSTALWATTLTVQPAKRATRGGAEQVLQLLASTRRSALFVLKDIRWETRLHLQLVVSMSFIGVVSCPGANSRGNALSVASKCGSQRPSTNSKKTLLIRSSTATTTLLSRVRQPLPVPPQEKHELPSADKNQLNSSEKNSCKLPVSYPNVLLTQRSELGLSTPHPCPEKLQTSRQQGSAIGYLECHLMFSAGFDITSRTQDLFAFCSNVPNGGLRSGSFYRHDWFGQNEGWGEPSSDN